MQNRSCGACLRLIPVVLLLVAANACGRSDRERFSFAVRDGVLYRGNKEFQLRAVEADHLLSNTTTREDVARFLNQLCLVGGNSVYLTLGSAFRDEERIDQDWATRFLNLTTETRWRQLGVILRLTSRLEPAEQEVRRKLIRVATQTFADSWDVVFLVQGDDSAQLATLFHDASSHLLVASPAAGDLEVATSVPDPSSPHPVLVITPKSPLPSQLVHYILSQGHSSFEKLKATYTPRVDSLPAPDSGGLSQKELEQGFVSLFDGKTFAGWEITGDPQCWTINDGAIEWTRRGGGNLRSFRPYDNFVLKFDFRIAEGGNSGIHLRAPLAGRASRIGFEFQLLGDYGDAPDKNGTGSVYDVVPPTVNASKPAGEWNSVELRCDGSRFHAMLNGTQVQDVDFDQSPNLKLRLRKGYIALQDHGRFISFKNIRIKVL